MKNRLLLKAALVVGMGVTSLMQPKHAQAASDLCYTCWQSDTCVDGQVGNAICQSLGGDLCPYYNTCEEFAPGCQFPYPYPHYVLITCAPNP